MLYAPLCHKEPAMSEDATLWHKIAGVATPRNAPLHRGGPVCHIVSLALLTS